MGDSPHGRQGESGRYIALRLTALCPSAAMRIAFVHQHFRCQLRRAHKGDDTGRYAFRSRKETFVGQATGLRKQSDLVEINGRFRKPTGAQSATLKVQAKSR